MKKLLIIVIISCLGNLNLWAQLENVIVEKTYIAGKSDTLSIDEASALEEGMVTYRVFIDLAVGCKLMSLFSSINHELSISSTHQFYKNTNYGEPYGINLRPSRLAPNPPLALDTWLTLGMATNNHEGVPKNMDNDGSILANNPYNMLKNEVNGITNLQSSDGLVPKTTTYSLLKSIPTTGTIFEKNATATWFKTNNGSLSVEKGITGPTQDNIVLVAQLTTKGKLTFTFNIEVLTETGKTIRFIGKDSLINYQNQEIYDYRLGYPNEKICGCMDANYLEYNPKAVCDTVGSCKTKIILGCTDPIACNFDPGANKNMPALCCYDSKCALDLGIICPGTVYGCMDPAAANYNPQANKPEPCYFSKGGCTDNRYLEYNPNALYSDSTLCKTIIVEGCMIPDSCNYNPVANRNKGCSNKDCQQSAPKLKSAAIAPFEFTLYPNPASNSVIAQINTLDEIMVGYEIFDLYGRKLKAEKTTLYVGGYISEIDISSFEKGIYLFRIQINNQIISKTLIKEL